MPSNWSDYWAQRAAFGFTPFRQIWLEEYLRLCKALCERFRLRTVLDVGCGTGVSGGGFTFYGVYTVLCDVNPWALKVAKKFFKGFPYVSCVLADGFHLPFRKNAFDLAVSEGLFEHFDFGHDVKLLKEKGKCSKAAMVIVPNSSSILYKLAKLLTKISGRAWPFGGKMERDVPELELLRMMNEAEFRVTILGSLGHTGHIATLSIVLLPSITRDKVGRFSAKNTLATSLMRTLTKVAGRVFFMPDQNCVYGVSKE